MGSRAEMTRDERRGGVREARGNARERGAGRCRRSPPFSPRLQLVEVRRQLLRFVLHERARLRALGEAGEDVLEGWVEAQARGRGGSVPQQRSAQAKRRPPRPAGEEGREGGQPHGRLFSPPG